jgi:hypothetical protein
MLQSLIQVLMQMVAQLQAQLAQKVTPTTTTTISNAGACSWCGGYCVFKTPNMLCADIAPPEGYRCAEGLNGQCEKVPFATNTTTTTFTCIDLKANSSNNSYFDSCKTKGFDKVCFNKYTGIYQGCGSSSYNSCTVNNTNANQNIWCDVTSTSADTTKKQCGAYYAEGTLNLGGIYLNLPAGYDQVTKEQCGILGQYYKESIKNEICSNIKYTDSQNVYIKWGDYGSNNLEIIDQFSAACQLAQPDKPDLTITNLTATKTTLNVGETTIISAKESNIGNATAGHHLTGIFEDNKETPLNSTEINTMAAGYGSYITANYTCYTAGTHTIQAIADYIHQASTGEVLESNENNNSQTITINCLAPTSALPDLTITDITSDKGDLYIGQTQTISVTEKNIGNAPAGAHSSAIFGDDSTSPVTGGLVQPQILLNGYGFVFSGNYTCTTAGYHTITAKVDYLNQVQESNESNNNSVITIHCLAPVSNLSVTCVSSKISNIFNVGESFAFFALPTGGSGSYSTIVWSGDVTGTGLSRIVSFSSPGTKTAIVKVTDSNGATATASCSVQIVNQSSLLDTLQNQLVQMSDLLKKLTAALIEMPR